MRSTRLLLASLAVVAVAGLPADAEGADAREPAKSPSPESKPSMPPKDDAEKFSYYLGYRNGRSIAAKPGQMPADGDAFLRGVMVKLAIEKPEAGDKDNDDFKKGSAVGAQIAAFARQRFPYLQGRKVAEGLEAGLAKHDAAYSNQEIQAALRACSKFVKTPRPAPSPMLGKQAPKWEVGRWHQLPEGKASLDISDFRGKVLYIYCFQSWCPGCHKQGFPTLQQVAGKYQDDDSVKFVVFQTVFEDRKDSPVNTFENLKKIAARYKLTMPFAQSGSHEDKSKVMRAYKTRGTPWTMIIDKKGVIRYSSFRLTPDGAARLIEKLKAENDDKAAAK